MEPWFYLLGPNQEHINKTTSGNYRQLQRKCRNIDYTGMDTYCANPSTVASLAYNLHVDGCQPQGRPKQRWPETINKDLRKTGLQPLMLTTDNYGDHTPTERTLHQRDKHEDEEDISCGNNSGLLLEKLTICIFVTQLSKFTALIFRIVPSTAIKKQGEKHC